MFIGIFPIWGFQTLAAIGLSLFFRLNKILTLLGSNISFPPLIPFILFISHWTGSFWLGAAAQTIAFDKSLTFEKMQDSLLQYGIGAVTLAILAGMLSGGITYLYLKFLRREKS